MKLIIDIDEDVKIAISRNPHISMEMYEDMKAVYTLEQLVDRTYRTKIIEDEKQECEET